MHFLAEADGAIFISRLVETEFYATLSKKKRTKELGSVKIASILKTFTKHIADGAFVLQPMTDQVFSSANTILRDMKSSLRTLDALHLAASKVARCELVTADKILAESAEMYKVPVRLI
jgi:predicted nucleic acid-binding protein